MLALVPGRVADADRACPVVAVQVVENLLGQLPLAADPVHDLQVGLLLSQVGQEVVEVVGVLVQPERVQGPQHERGIAQPAEPVVVVALAARCFRQRGRRGGKQCPGGRVDQALQGERRAFQVRPPRMIGEVAPADPLVPEVPGPRQPLMGLVKGARRGRVTPRQRAVHLIAGAQPPPRHRDRSLDPQVQVGGELELRLAVKHRFHLAVALPQVPPGTAPAAVIVGRVALQDEVNGAVQAPDRAEQDVLGGVVGRGSLVQGRPGRVVPPGAHQQHVADDRPAGGRRPRRLKHHGPGQVAPSGGHQDVRGPQPERARAPVKDGPEDARAVHPGQAHPLDAAARRDERGYHLVGQKAVVGDRGERAPLLSGVLPQRAQVDGIDQRIIAGQVSIDGHRFPLGAQHTRRRPYSRGGGPFPGPPPRPACFARPSSRVSPAWERPGWGPGGTRLRSG